MILPRMSGASFGAAAIDRRNSHRKQVGSGRWPAPRLPAPERGVDALADRLLAGSATAPGLSVSGLRLTDGSLVPKLERGGAAPRFRLKPGGGFDAADGVLARHHLLADSRRFVTRLQTSRALAVGDGPRQVCSDKVSDG